MSDSEFDSAATGAAAESESDAQQDDVDDVYESVDDEDIDAAYEHEDSDDDESAYRDDVDEETVDVPASVVAPVTTASATRRGPRAAAAHAGPRHGVSTAARPPRS